MFSAETHNESLNAKLQLGVAVNCVLRCDNIDTAQLYSVAVCICGCVYVNVYRMEVSIHSTACSVDMCVVVECGCAYMWLCVYVAVCICGCVYMRVVVECGCAYMWLCVYAAVRICGCVYMWLCVYVAVCICGCVYMWLCVYVAVCIVCQHIHSTMCSVAVYLWKCEM
jgi:hypothetical protein